VTRVDPGAPDIDRPNLLVRVWLAMAAGATWPLELRSLMTAQAALRYQSPQAQAALSASLRGYGVSDRTRYVDQRTARVVLVKGKGTADRVYDRPTMVKGLVVRVLDVDPFGGDWRVDGLGEVDTRPAVR